MILGRRLANRESDSRKIGVLEGVPAMGLDGLGSSAYGPEAALTILAPLGAAGLSLIGWVMAPIVALLAILFASYWQTIRAYPGNGGAYIVARENLGAAPSLLAAAALMVDYVLNVAVGISAGVAALVSAAPALQAWTLPLCLGILAIITLANLRGTGEASRVFAVPTYLFIASFLVILAIGLWRTAMAGGAPQPVVAPAPLPEVTEGASFWLLLRAFAAGCTAMTGVEAVSNGMSAFRDPPVRHGHRTLTAIVAVLGLLLAGVAALSQAYDIGAMDQTKDGYRSVLAQLAGAVIGQSLFYYVAIGALLVVLTLSANTSFVGFPRLCRIVAEDGFLPKSFSIAGRRLVFDVGLVFLAAAAGVLLAVFGGITDRLIPLFAIGAFLTFTLSQTGMVFHWRRVLRDGKGGRATRAHLAVNLAGAVTTGGALAIIVVAKFFEGAWITVLVIPLVILLLRAIRRYYDDVEAQLREDSPLDLTGLRAPLVLVAFRRWTKPGEHALRFALGISPDVIGVHLTELSGPDHEERLRALKAEWARDVEEPAATAGLTPPRLLVLEAQHRLIEEPILQAIGELEREFPDRPVAVLVPELVGQRWYQHLLHTRQAQRLRKRLMAHAGARVMVISVPWQLAPAVASPPQS